MDSFDKPQTSLDYQIEKFRKILDSNPEDLSVLMAYAEANLRKGNRLESMKAYQKVISLKPDVTDVRVALVKIYFSMNNFKDAYTEISRIFDKDARHIEAHLLLRKLSRASKIPGDLQEILEPHLTFTAAPKKIRILQKLYEMEKRKYGRLIEDYDRQLQDDSGSPIIMYNRTKAMERVKFAEETLQDLESMVGEEEEEEVRYEGLQVPEIEIEIAEAAVEEAPAEEAVVEEYTETVDDTNDWAVEENTSETSEEDIIEEVIDVQEPVVDSVEENAGALETDESTEESMEVSGDSVEMPLPGDSEEVPDVVEEMITIEEEQALEAGLYDSREVELPAEEPASQEEPVMSTEEIVAATFGNDLPDLPAEIEESNEEPETPEQAEMPDEYLFESQDGTPILSRSEEIRIQELNEIEQIPIEGLEEVITEVQPEGETIEIENVGFLMEQTPPAISEETKRKHAFYESIKDDIEKLLTTISKTRGINASLIIDNEGTLIHSISTEQFDYQKLISEILQGIQPLLGWAQQDSQRKLFYWVLEFNSGLMVLYPLRNDVFLVVTGKQGANFGAIRFSIEKNSEDIVALFENVPV